MLIDPIDWAALKYDLLEWSHALSVNLIISRECDALFHDRTPPSHRARVRSSPAPKPATVYRFFYPHSSSIREEKHLIDRGIPADLANLIDRGNRHDQALAVLGILPNQLRTILRSAGINVEEAWVDISKTLFWEGYKLWCKRKRLMKHFWKNVAPEEWNKYKKRSRKEVKNNTCVDPFHFLVKSDDTSKEKATNCYCTKFHRSRKRLADRDISTFIDTFPILQPQNPKRPRNVIVRQCKRQKIHNVHRKTRTDRIRDQHDRGKRKKQSDITTFLIRNM